MGITLASNFDVNAALPLDSRTKVADITARNAIVSGQRYIGLTVHVLSDSVNYQLVGGILDANWTDIRTLTSYLVQTNATGITAFAGGGQGSATQLAKDINRVTTCATSGDSVKLPAGVAGMKIVVINDGAASMNIFPATGEQIDALGVNAAYALATTSANASFICAATGIWKSAAGAGGGTLTAPLITKYTTGTGNFTKTGSPLYLRVRMVGGGGGGAGSGTASAGNGSNGVATTFGTTLLSAGGGVGALASSYGGNGGASSLGTGPIGMALTGGMGAGGDQPGTGNFAAGGAGGDSPFFGGGGKSSNVAVATTTAGQANTGGGGQGGSTITPAASNNCGSGGGSGGYVEAIISSPSATYAYAVGTGGAGGTAGTNGGAGGAGGTGAIYVEEYYS
jgi:hypothetical protein